MDARRLTAALIAATVLVSVGTQYAVVMAALPQFADPLVRLSELLRYFTILTNLLVGGLMLAVALGWHPTADWRATAFVSITLVGAVFHVLLVTETPLQGAEWWTDFGYHTVVPIAYALWWLAWGSVGVRLNRLPLWLLWPLVYCAYALLRGQIDGRYPYFFLNINQLGVVAVLGWIAVMIAAVSATGVAGVAAARLLGRLR